MLVLGVASLDQDSAVALLDDKSILAAIEEEKVDRAPGVSTVPAAALQRVLDQNNITPAELDSAALADSSQEARLRESGLGSKFSASRKRRSARDLRKSTAIPQLRELLNNDSKVKLKEYEHHLCHAASAYYTSEFDRALILTLDGGVQFARKSSDFRLVTGRRGHGTRSGLRHLTASRLLRVR